MIPFSCFSIIWLRSQHQPPNLRMVCDKSNIDQGRSYEDQDINISDCFFSRTSQYTGDGGVIYVSSGSHSMYVSFSMFYNCTCSSWGGAIYFTSDNSVLRMICANECSAFNGFFASILSSQENLVEYLSASKCSQVTTGRALLSLFSGNQRVGNTNSSMNSASMYSGIYIYGPSSFTSSYCTFSNNYVSSGCCIFFYSTSGTISMIFSNIVHNKSPNNEIVSAGGAGSKNMMYCIFHSNEYYLFNVWEGSLEVSHSFIDHPSSSFSVSTAVSTANNSLISKPTYDFQFYKSHYCHADNPITFTTDAKCNKSNIDQGRSYEDQDINISDCFFSRTSQYTGDGGVIYVNGGSYSMYVSFSMFFECVCSQNGGSIFFTSSCSSLRMICANRCSARDYPFAFLWASQLNQIEYISVSYSYHSSEGNCPLGMHAGNQKVDNTNSSMNSIKQTSGIATIYPSSFSSSYCTFSNNKASSGVCISITSTSGMISISYANVIHNNSPSLAVVNVYGTGSRKMMYCIFQNNQNYLFVLWDGSLEVSHSFIDHPSLLFSTFIFTDFPISTANNSLISKPTYDFQFYKSHYCHAENPLQIQTPFESCINLSIDSGRSHYYLSNNDYSIHGCFFERFQVFNDYGGVIYISHVGDDNIRECMFFGCYSSKGGGAISINSRKTLISRLCFNNCSSLPGGDAIYSSHNDSQYDLISACRCSVNEHSGSVIDVSLTTFIKIIQSNMSINGSPSISFSGFSQQMNISNSIISRNLCTGRDQAFFCWNKVFVEFVSFISNDYDMYCIAVLDYSDFQKCIFYQNNHLLFHFDKGPHSITKCFISHEGGLYSFVSGSSYSVSDNNYVVNQDHAFSYFSSHHCQTANGPEPLYPASTPKLSPHSTPSNTPCMSPKETHLQTPKNSPVYTVKETPFITPMFSPSITPNINCINESIDYGSSFMFDGISVFEISDCSFKRLHCSWNSGGVIFILNSGIVNITNCMFFGSCSFVDGGAICLQSSYSLLSKLCFNNCSARYGAAIDGSHNKCDYEMLSICMCQTHTYAVNVLELFESNQILITQLNNSKNGVPPIYIISNQEIVIKQSTLSNNKFSDNYKHNTYIFGYYGSTLFDCEFVSFISNEYDNRCVYSSGQSNIRKSIFYNNNNNLFDFNQGSHSISNCFISHYSELYVFSTGSTVSFFNNDYKVDNDHTFSYFSSYHCEKAYVPVRVYPRTPSPSSTIKETPIPSIKETPFFTPLQSEFPPTPNPSYGNGLTCSGENIYRGLSYLDINIDLRDCTFSRLASNIGDGGVILVNGGSYSMKLNQITFNDCSSTMKGGAICFVSSNSNMENICAYRCYSFNGHFAYLKTSQDNRIRFLSMTSCSYVSTPYMYYSIRLDTGNHNVENTNSSMNHAYQGSGITITSPTSCTISHCTFSNNYVSNSACIFFTVFTGILRFTNIVHNTSPTNAIEIWGGSSKFHYCIFDMNEKDLFFTSGGLEVFHCFINQQNETFNTWTRGLLETNNNSIIQKQTYQLQFFKAPFCNTDSPALTRTFENTVENTPCYSQKETPIFTPFESTIPPSPIPTVGHTPFPTYVTNLNDRDQCKKLDTISGRSYIDVISCFILECSFTRIGLLNGNGGVVFIRVANSDLSVVQTVFTNCQVDPNGYFQGGAIFYDSYSSGESYIKSVCAFGCTAYWGHFAIIGDRKSVV